MPTNQALIVNSDSAAVARSNHDRHCFIVMPFGRDAAEQKWFRGWYEVVIKPAVLEAGYEAKTGSR